jgi:hypothetical protein
LFLLFLDLQLTEVPAIMYRGPEVLSPADAAAVSFLRRRIRAGELVYRSQQLSLGYAQWGGLPQPWIDWAVWTHGYEPARLLARGELLGAQPADLEAWRRDGFRYFVLDDTPGDRRLQGHASAWIAAGKAKLVATFGAIQVIEVT